MSADRDDDLMLKALLNAAQSEGRDAPSELLARVLEDAYREQPVPAAAVAMSGATGRRGNMGRMRGWWPAISGLSIAGMLGLWVGLSVPADLSDRIGWGTPLDAVELIPSYNAFLSEG